MFKIDFLKSQGLPIRSKPLDAAIVTIAVMISLVVLCLMFTVYVENSITLKTNAQQVTSLEMKLKLARTQNHKALGADETLAVYEQCYKEIANSIGRYVQWTPILHKLAETLSPSMLLNELSVQRTIEKLKVTSVKDPNKKVDYEIINRMLKGDLYDFMPEADDTEVKTYLATLRDSNWFGDVYLAQSSDSEFDDRKIKNHIINCQLKSRQTVDTKR